MTTFFMCFLYFVPMSFYPKLPFYYYFVVHSLYFVFLKMKLIKCVDDKYRVSAPSVQRCNSHSLICTDVSKDKCVLLTSGDLGY